MPKPSTRSRPQRCSAPSSAITTIGSDTVTKRERMREAMMDYLYNDDTGAFVLNYDQDGKYQDDFTADEIFPVLFGIADPAQRRAILERLQEADFVTAVGLRTISTADAWYFPSYGFGIARRHLAGPDAVVRGRTRAQRHDRRSGAFSQRFLRGNGRRKPPQHRAGRVRGVVRWRIAQQSRNVSLALDRREVSCGLWPRRSAV